MKDDCENLRNLRYLSEYPGRTLELENGNYLFRLYWLFLEIAIFWYRREIEKSPSFGLRLFHEVEDADHIQDILKRKYHNCDCQSSHDAELGRGEIPGYRCDRDSSKTTVYIPEYRIIHSTDCSNVYAFLNPPWLGILRSNFSNYMRLRKTKHDGEDT